MSRVHDDIITRLQTLNPVYINLINESMQHVGYFEGKESHFKLVIVSAAFDNIRAVGRHQKIYALLSDLMTSQGGSIHALAIHAYTPEQWQNMASNETQHSTASIAAVDKRTGDKTTIDNKTIDKDAINRNNIHSADRVNRESIQKVPASPLCAGQNKA